LVRTVKRLLAVFVSAVRDEARILVTRPWDAFVAFGLPLILLMVIAAMLAPGVIRQAPVAVVDQDNSAFSRAAIRNMEASPGVRVTHAPATMTEAMALMRRGEIYSVAHFPADFSDGAFRRPEQVTVSFNCAFQTVGALSALGQSAAIASAAGQQLQERARQRGLPETALQLPAVQVSIVGNPQLSFELFLGGLLAPGVLHLLAACSAVLAVGRLMQGGSFKCFKAETDGFTTTALIGRLIPHFVIFSLWGLAWIAWLSGVRGWGVAGSLPLLILGILALMAVSVVLSAFLVAALGEVDMAFSATAIYSGAAIAFSNGTLPLDHGPRFARIWSDILPYTHYLRLQTGQLVTSATSASAWRDLMILSGVAVVGLLLSALFIRGRARLVPKPENLNFPLPQQGVIAAFAATFRNLPRARPVSSLLILAVVLYAFYYPAAYAGQAATALPIAVATPTQTALTRTLVEDLNASREIEVAGTDQLRRNDHRERDVLRDPRGGGLRCRAGRDLRCRILEEEPAYALGRQRPDRGVETVVCRERRRTGCPDRRLLRRLKGRELHDRQQQRREQERRRQALFEPTVDNLDFIVQVCQQGRQFAIYRADVSAQWKTYLEATARARLRKVDTAAVAPTTPK
jgi:ABC-2 type transport system permease protein